MCLCCGVLTATVQRQQMLEQPYILRIDMLEIVFIFFILSGVFAWGVIAYVVLKLFMGD